MYSHCAQIRIRYSVTFAECYCVKCNSSISELKQMMYNERILTERHVASSFHLEFLVHVNTGSNLPW